MSARPDFGEPRDPQRIDPLLEQIRRCWIQNTDLRLGQILVNAASLGGWRDSDIFNCDDDTMLRGLQETEWLYKP